MGAEILDCLAQFFLHHLLLGLLRHLFDGSSELFIFFDEAFKGLLGLGSRPGLKVFQIFFLIDQFGLDISRLVWRQSGLNR